MKRRIKPKKEDIKITNLLLARGVGLAVGNVRNNTVGQKYERLITLDYGLDKRHNGKNWIGGANGVWKHEEIVYVQAIYNTLVNLGYIKGKTIKIDGVYGAKTKEAIKKLQKLAGAKTDGYFGIDTRNKLAAWVTRNKNSLQNKYSELFKKPARNRSVPMRASKKRAAKKKKTANQKSKKEEKKNRKSKGEEKIRDLEI